MPKYWEFKQHTSNSPWVKDVSGDTGIVERFFAIPWTVVYQASLSMGFSRQEYWSGLPLPSPLKGMGQLYFNRIVLLKKSKVYGDSIVQDETCRSIA